MRTLFVIVLVAFGTIFFLSPYFVIGVLAYALANFVWQTRNHKDEDQLITVLALMAGLGVVAVVLEDVLARFGVFY